MDLSLNWQLAEDLASPSQIARVVTQDWVSRELPCLSCSSRPLRATPQNTKALDFTCSKCDEPYELKSTGRVFTHRILDGEYRTLLSIVNAGKTPNLLLMEFAKEFQRVRSLMVVHRSLLSAQAIVPRNRLSNAARRAGWQGCYIDLDRVLPSGRVRVIRDFLVEPWSGVSEAWDRYRFMVQLKPEERAWLADVAACIQRLSEPTFDLTAVYRFEPELAQGHPNNAHLHEKIRQQLQVMVARGLLRRVRRGVYQRAQIDGGGTARC